MKNIGILIFNILLLISCSTEQPIYSDCPQLEIPNSSINQGYPLDYLYFISDYKDDDSEYLKIPIQSSGNHKFIEVCFSIDDDDIYISSGNSKIEVDDECIFSSTPNRFVNGSGDIYFTSKEFEIDYNHGRFYLNKEPIKQRMYIKLYRNTFKISSHLLITNFKSHSLDSLNFIKLLGNNFSAKCNINNYTSKFDLYKNKSIRNNNLITLYDTKTFMNYSKNLYRGMGYLDTGNFILPITNKSKLIYTFSNGSILSIPINMNIHSNDNIEMITIVDIYDIIHHTRNSIRYIFIRRGYSSNG